MRKIFCLILVIMMSITLFSCGKAADKNATKEAVMESEKRVETTAKEETVKNVTVGQLTNIVPSEKKEANIKSDWEKKYGGTYNVSVMYFDTLDSALLALSRKDIDVVSSYDCVNRYIMSKNKNMYDIADTDWHHYFSIALPKEKTDWLSKINDALDKLAYDGIIEELTAKYIDNSDFSESSLPVELPKIDGADTIKILVTGDLPPLDFVTASGRPAGFNVALLSAISKEAKLNFELICANTGSKELMITSGKADAIFWARGTTRRDSSDIDFGQDLPDGFTVTTSYAKLNVQDLFLK